MQFIILKVEVVQFTKRFSSFKLLPTPHPERKKGIDWDIIYSNDFEGL